MSEKMVSISFPGINVAYLLNTKCICYYNPRKYLKFVLNLTDLHSYHFAWNKLYCYYFLICTLAKLCLRFISLEIPRKSVGCGMITNS